MECDFCEWVFTDEDIEDTLLATIQAYNVKGEEITISTHECPKCTSVFNHID